MSKITIEEIESVSSLEAEITDNEVLIPLLLKPVGTGKEEMKPKLYLSKDKFIEDYSNSDVVTYGSNSIDKSYYMIQQLLFDGLKVVVLPLYPGIGSYNDENELILGLNNILGGTAQSIPESHVLYQFRSKNIFNIKFITSGAWPNLFIGSSNEMLGCHKYLTLLASERKDCIAFVEILSSITPENILIDKIFGGNSFGSKYSPCLYPSYNSSFASTIYSDELEMPAAFGYLRAYANNIKNKPNWFAVAGVDRGYIPGFNSAKYEITESQMEYFNGEAELSSNGLKDHINVIMNLGSYGTRIWGNKVSKKDSENKNLYTTYLNVRLLICDINRKLYHSAIKNTFEPNDDITWNNFKSIVNDLLDDMVSGRGLSWYCWKKEKSDKKATIKARLSIKPIEAVEAFDLTLYITDQDVSTIEGEI